MRSTRLAWAASRTATKIDGQNTSPRPTPPGTAELRQITLPDGAGDAGTQLMSVIADTLAEEPRARIAGILAVSDGRVHDADLPIDLPAPMHLLMTGKETDWDRRLSVRNAPAFAIIGEPVTLTLRIDDLGAVPVTDQFATLDISIDGAPAQTFSVPIGQDLDLPI